MIPEKRFLLYNAAIATGEGVRNGSVAVCGERISDVWYPDGDGLLEFNGSMIPAERLCAAFSGAYPEAVIYDLSGKVMFAGGIDAHVHFREPGMTDKADMETESLAAILGGVTSFMDMPNTNPPTVSAARLQDKLEMAQGRCHANYGFHIGATNTNIDMISRLIGGLEEDGSRSLIGAGDFGGIKVFMGSSTGNMLVDSETALAAIFRREEKEVLVHCEDEAIIRANLLKAEEESGGDIPFRMHEYIRSRKACIRSSARALEMAMEYGTRLHLLHISTAEEVEMVRAAKQINKNITAETSINYLWFNDTSYDTLESKVKCNPSIKSENDRDVLKDALRNGLIDTIGTDHAPHLESEKDRPYLTAPSGIPSIQHSLPVLLTVAAQESIPLSRIASVFSEKAASMFGIADRGKIKAGYYADITVADPEKEFTVRREDLKYKCGWTPYEGACLKGCVEMVFVNGHETVRDGQPSTGTAFGKKLTFKN